MRIIAPMMILIMMTSTLAGCTGGDPDGGGNDEIDMDILNQLIDDNLQDFINNTTISVENHYHNNTTIVNNDNSENNFSDTSMGSNFPMMMVDFTFTIDDLLPEGIEQIDYRNNTFNYMWTYYDFLTNSQRTDLFVFSCQVYYIVGSQSDSNQTTYWNSSRYTYTNAWDNMYNSTVSDLLDDAAYDTSYDGIEIRELCDENYLQDTLDTDDLVITEIEIPEGFALQCVMSPYGAGYYGVEHLYKERLDGTWDQLWSYNEAAQKWIYGDYFYCHHGFVGGLEDTTLKIQGHHDMDMNFDGEYRYVFYYQLVPVTHVT